MRMLYPNLCCNKVCYRDGVKRLGGEFDLGRNVKDSCECALFKNALPCPFWHQLLSFFLYWLCSNLSITPGSAKFEILIK